MSTVMTKVDIDLFYRVTSLKGQEPKCKCSADSRLYIFIDNVMQLYAFYTQCSLTTKPERAEEIEETILGTETKPFIFPLKRVLKAD